GRTDPLRLQRSRRRRIPARRRRHPHGPPRRLRHRGREPGDRRRGHQRGGRERGMNGAIVVGYTARDAGADAAARGARLARSLGGRLRLVIVLPSEGTRSAAVPPERAYEDVIRAQGKKWLAEAMTHLPQELTRSGHVRLGESFAE